MNSRNSVNESNLVNFSSELTSLNQIETKDGILSFPFDHIYACHSESSERRQTIPLDKEVEISTHCVVAEGEGLVASASPEVARLSEQLTNRETQNKKLKELLVYHLDLIQQQNDFITKRDKLYQTLKQENETLKARLNRMDRRVTLNQRQNTNPPPLVNVAPSTITQSSKIETATSQIMLNSYRDVVLPENRTSSLVFDTDLQKEEPFELNRTSGRDVSKYLNPELGVLSLLDNKGLSCQDYKMIENKQSFVKKEIKGESRQEAMYTVSTGNSANPVIQRIQRSRRKPGTGCLSRMPRAPAVKVEPETTNHYPDDKSFDRNYTVNKKSKMINTYGKSSRNGSQKKLSIFTGSLSDRLQLIDTTPTGADPYQLGEDDMREQSPIPKLMLQKNNQGRMKIFSSNSNSTVTSRHLYDSTIVKDVNKGINKIKLNRYNLPNPYVHPSEIKKEDSSFPDEPELDIVKTEPEIDWRLYSKAGNETSLCDFSYGENASNLTPHILPSLDSVEFQDLFNTDPPLYSTDNSHRVYNPKEKREKSIKRGERTTSLMISNNILGEEMPHTDDKRGRKRALSTTGFLKTMKKENTPKLIPTKPKLVKGKAAASRGKKTPLPGIETKNPYHTVVGDPDLSWYLGVDPDVKPEDVVQSAGDSVEATVEVPRWREKLYTSCYTMEGTENLDDKVFEKRHQKLEAEERRQLRWHMRRVREQRHVERLRQRQRDSWCSGAYQQPSTFTVWPQPLRDVKYIEITDTLPVNAFGEAMPAVAEADFKLPWIRSSKPLKRYKRSKTLH